MINLSLHNLKRACPTNHHIGSPLEGYSNYPKTLEYEEKTLVVGEGRFGPYVNTMANSYLFEDNRPMELTLEEAIDLVEKKRLRQKESSSNSAKMEA